MIKLKKTGKFKRLSKKVTSFIYNLFLRLFMDEKDCEIKKAMKSLEKKEINVDYNKVLTVSLFFLFLIAGFIVIDKQNNVTGFMAKTLERTNSCYIDQKAFPTNKIECTFINHGEDYVDISLTYFDVNTGNSLLINSIKVNDCITSSNVILQSGDPYIYRVECRSLENKNELILTYTSQMSGIQHSVKGKINLVY
jgi:hypothetical protein